MVSDRVRLHLAIAELLDAGGFSLLCFMRTSERGSYPEWWRVTGPVKPGNRRRGNMRGYGANSCPGGARYEGCRSELPSQEA